ncbi:hypothetical protein N7493_009169 [Penicillium malachiteum]|uniref:Uncharacterized protein n=1 Tax=Penicillium malachiteum TaxID=1324776 RepID=A0AAD6HGK9_9EURO|nr:hypothetical protein N7493_009169 [Penicillium malachiteum]
MGDATRPSDDKFNQVLQHSFKTWSSYLDTSKNPQLPRHSIDLRPLIDQTPPFLGGDPASSDLDEPVSFFCEVTQNGSLFVNCRSTWRTTKGDCDLAPIVMPKKLTLGIGRKLTVKLSENAAFSDWHGVQGLSGYDEGNYLAVLFLVWAYILSARWVELLGHSADHECNLAYTTNTIQAVGDSELQQDQRSFEIDIGDDACEEEIFWWRAILGSGWEATTKYKDQVFLSPWSVSTDVRFTLAKHGGLDGTSSSSLPQLETALKYLAKFCAHHDLYAQCSVALVGVIFIPLLGNQSICLPFPKQNPHLQKSKSDINSACFIQNLIEEHSKSLPRYMTLSSNTWGLRALLSSTFFNADIECNLVSAWLNPAFGIIQSISSENTALATFLANRQPRLGILWLGAILTGIAKRILQDTRMGMTCLDLPVSAWSGVRQSFLTSETVTIHDEVISRADECRMLFMTASASECHSRPPLWHWKPFGSTKFCDTELSVQLHAQCTSHCLEYEAWEWILTNGISIRVGREPNEFPVEMAGLKEHGKSSHEIPAKLQDYSYDFSSQTLSEGLTRGIFGWLRPTGYPLCERPIYQHSWFDLEGSDDEEPDDAESDEDGLRKIRKTHVESWLEDIGCD